MTEDQITIAANSICGLIDVTDCQLDDILEVLAAENIISKEDCGAIKERISNI